MSILLLGHWDAWGNLRVEESHEVEDGNQEEIDPLVGAQDDANNAWACEFLVDDHRTAVQMAYEEYVAHKGTRLVDIVHGVEPLT